MSRKSDGSDPSKPPNAKAGNHYRAIFLSDIHLGTAGCKAAHLLDFLRHNESDRLYLVGDIIDGWALRSRFYWPQAHNDVIQKILRKARKGTTVYYVPGNHDEVARQFCGLKFGDVSICEEADYQLKDGRRLWVVHGDIADGVIRHVKWLAHVGDALYDWLLWLNRHLNNLRARFGFGYWSLSQYLKYKVKNAVSFISDFEAVLVREARRRGYDGVICGHIHHAQIRTVDGALYVNDGDWVESLTALVETHEGELRILVWDQILAPDLPSPHWSLDEHELASPVAPVAEPCG
ncbi:MAG TPA: UDP-2,3-diacylglucosamine diphosphatase [Burkholderiaceae bacterium]|nr:UDP-2,3-diacylglucosamine diphosphatase [Burkholderiaceae bacterium]